MKTDTKPELSRYFVAKTGRLCMIMRVFGLKHFLFKVTGIGARPVDREIEFIHRNA